MVIIPPRRGGGGDGRKGGGRYHENLKNSKKTIANSLFVLKRETGTLNKNSGENVRPYPH